MDQKIYRARKLGTRLAISGRSFRWNTVASFVGYEGRGRPGCGGILFPEERREDSWIPKKKKKERKKKCIGFNFFPPRPFSENFAFGRRIEESCASLPPPNLWRPIEALELRNSQGREGDERERFRIDDRRMDPRSRHATCRVIEQVLRQTRIASLSCSSTLEGRSRRSRLPPRDFLGSVTAISLSIWFDAIISRQLTWWMKLIEILFSYSDSLLNLLFFLMFEYFGEI